MSLSDACCTCATLLTDTKVPYDEDTEKPLVLDRKLDCCGRTICATCQWRNNRFKTYCPFCQISTEPNALPPAGLRLPPPPSYATSSEGRTQNSSAHDLPPAYESLPPRQVNGAPAVSPPTDTRDIVHFVGPKDTIQSLSIAYSVPAPVLRTHNTIFQDSLLQARKFVLVPHTHYQGPSLSTPPDPEEEERKNKVRRWMVTTKCADYNVALLYLKGSDYDLEIAVDSYKADEQWEKENPMAKGKGKNGDHRRRPGGGSLAGQLS